MTTLHAREHTVQDLKSSSESLQASTPSLTAQQSDGASRASEGQCTTLHPKSGPQQPHLGTTMPSPSSSRSKMIFDSGSVSDSGIASRPPRSSSRYLDVASAHKGRFLPLDVRHASPSSPNLSLPGYLSDGCIPEHSPSPLHPSRLDVKRLLSKPAAPSVVSNPSITSEPESHVFFRSTPNPSEAWLNKANVQAQPKLIGPATISRSESSEREPSPATLPSLQQRPRNLLRKKSGSEQTGLAMLAATTSETSVSSPSRSNTHSPAAVPSRSRRATALQSLIGSRPTIVSSAQPYGSGRLTPAGAIAQAYKEQDSRREALAAAAHAEKLSPIIPISASWLDTFEHYTPEQNITPTAGNTPHYPEMASSLPDSFVIVDSAQEALHHAGEHNPSAPSSGSGDPSATVIASQPVKSLSRKVSARLRRGLAAVSGAGAQSGNVHGDGEGEQTERFRGDFDSGDRRERQRSLSLRKAKHKPEPLRLSLDAPHASSSMEVFLGQPTHGESALASENILAQSKGKGKAQEKEDIGAGAKLWRLVKRISSGGLRERFQTASVPAPPVPAMPKDLPSLPYTTLEVQVFTERTSGDGGADASQGGDSGKGMMNNCVDSNLSTSGISPQSDGHSSTASCMPLGIHASFGAGSHPRRPSISSSPQSSEPTSTHFFRSHSSRSSFSSIAGTSPPLQQVPIHGRVRSPSPRTRLRTKSSSLSSSRDMSNNEPQRSGSPHGRTRKHSSPDVPTFSISDVVNNFILRRPSLARHGRRHVSARSLSRLDQPTSAGEVSAAPLRRAGSEVRRPTRQHGRIEPMLAPSSSGQNRDSHGSDSTERPPSTSTATVRGLAGASAGSNSVGRLTFRELGGTRGQAWSSQEKEDKWDDLLERSARAGGTLHLGAGSARLASDNIRFSSSTLASETSGSM
ncbi:hypothetical protein BJV74DRAFT_393349 [Russula compacta]|nr:hypothetical protein BJV74DRAFT_393349 [Russula compacta]